MTSDDYRRAGLLFDQIRELLEEERVAALDAACEGNAELRAQVQHLLDSDRGAAGGAFLERHAIEDAAGLLASQALQLPSPGTVIGNYCLGARIGAGGMGAVYEAQDLRLQRRVAIKILALALAEDGAELVSRFQREARAVALLTHPNVVSIFDADYNRGYWYIATEFIEGVTLRQRLAAGKPDFVETLEIVIQCAAALTAAHKTGVLHRDIKPENIMLRPDGLVKVVDFGLARVMSAAQDSGNKTETQPGRAIGTPRYMSPEQARGERPDARGDVFSLGAVLYEMTAGCPAFPGATTAEIFAALLTAEPRPPSAYKNGSPAGLDAIVSKALAKDSASRYQSMDEFAADLRGLKKQLEARQQVDAWRSSHKTLRRARVLLGAVVLAAMTGLLWYAWTTPRGKSNDVQAEVVPLTSSPGLKDYPALSPDGTKVAFSWNGGSSVRLERNIYVKPVGNGEPVQLTSAAQDDVWPAWSPDGRYIAFGRRLQEPKRIVYIVPSGGGPERKVAEGGDGASWSPDGKTLALARQPWPAESGGIYLLDVEAGASRELTSPQPDSDDHPVFSPNGRWIAFTRRPAQSRPDIWVMPLDGGGAAKRLTFDARTIIGFTWAANSSEIIYSTRREGAGASLWWIPVAGGSPKYLALPTASATNPNISPRSGRLVFNQAFIDTNIYRSDGPGFAGKPAPGRFGGERGLILSSREDDSPNFSADGQWIAFVSNRSGNSEIWIARQDGRLEVQLTSLQDFTVGTPRWSPDGRWIAFDGTTGGNTDIYVIGADGGSPRRLTIEPSADVLPSWSTDGKWIYFTSDRSGTMQLWKTPATGGGPAVQLTRGGARESWPSPDGKLLYFTKRRPEADIWTVPTGGGIEQPVPELAGFTRIGRAWGVTQEGIYFISQEARVSRQEVRFFSFATRSVSAIATLERDILGNLPALALSPGGRSLLTVHLDHEMYDLMMVEHFR